MTDAEPQCPQCGERLHIVYGDGPLFYAHDAPRHLGGRNEYTLDFDFGIPVEG